MGCRNLHLVSLCTSAASNILALTASDAALLFAGWKSSGVPQLSSPSLALMPVHLSLAFGLKADQDLELEACRVQRAVFAVATPECPDQVQMRCGLGEVNACWMWMDRIMNKRPLPWISDLLDLASPLRCPAWRRPVTVSCG